ncbi:MAG: hypothetical protein AB1466_06375 [Actinomycetota bacterium]
MEEFFERREAVEAVEYPQYFLGKNPFPPEVIEEGEDKRSLFTKEICKKETNKVLSLIKTLVKEPKAPNVWILKDAKASGEYNISVMSGLFRTIFESKTPRLFPVYIPLPLIYENPLQGIFKIIMDRFIEMHFRRCVYAFIYEELKKLQASGKAPEVLPDVDITKLLKDMNETEGQALDQILFIEEEEKEAEKKEEVEEGEEAEEVEEAEEGKREEREGVEEAKEAEEGEAVKPEAEEQEEEVKEETEEEKKRREMRENLVKFIEGALEKTQFGSQIKEAITLAVKEGFSEGHSRLQSIVDYRETLPGLLQLILAFYEKVVIFIDQLEGWTALEDSERAMFFGAVAELKWLSAGKSLLTFACLPYLIEQIGEEYLSGRLEISLDLSLCYLDISTPIDHKQATDLLTSFLKSDFYRSQELENMKSKGLNELYPFSEDGVKEMVSLLNGDALGILSNSGRLIEEGKLAGYPAIDAKFVEKKIKGQGS